MTSLLCRLRGRLGWSDSERRPQQGPALVVQHLTKRFGARVAYDDFCRRLVATTFDRERHITGNRS
jgi:hypothetical protein